MQTKRNNTLLWRKKTKKPFTQLILSWNASRPPKGFFTFWVRVRHHYWSRWQKIAEWGKSRQKSFSRARDHFVHPAHVRIEMQRNRLGFAYEIKVVAERGAKTRRLHALFVNASNENSFVVTRPGGPLQSKLVTGIPKQSQWKLPHKRTKDLCSPTSTSIITTHLAKEKGIFLTPQSLNKRTAKFAQAAYDQSFDIYGNWAFNTAEAYNMTRGKMFYRVERLNNFESLHKRLVQNIPVAVSILGKINGGAWPYNSGHFIVVIGWNQKTKRVICIDPAFKNRRQIVRHYRIRDFMRAWGRSRNLAYVPIPAEQLPIPNFPPPEKKTSPKRKLAASKRPTKSRGKASRRSKATRKRKQKWVFAIPYRWPDQIITKA